MGKSNFILSIIIISFIFVSMISMVSALDFDNSQKVLDTYGTAGYKDIEIKNAFGLGAKLWSGTLNSNTEICGINCEAIQTITLHEKGSLVDDVIFERIYEDGSRRESNIRSYQVYVNGRKYELGTSMDAGNYEVKLEGSKRPDWSYDWIYKTQGESLDEWAVWGAGYINRTYDEINTSSIDTTKWINNSYPTLINNDYINLYASGTNVPWLNSTSLNATYVQELYIRTNNSWNDNNGGGSGLFSGVYFYVFGNLIDSAYRTDSAGSGSFSAEYNWTFVRNISGNFSVYRNNVFQKQIIPTDNQIFFNSSTDGSGGDTGTIQAYQKLFYVRYYGTDGGSYIILNSPENNYISPTNNVQFNATATVTGGATLTNMSLWHNNTGTWERNQTLTKTGTTNESIFTLTLPEATPTLCGIEACDSDGDCEFSVNRTVSVDTVAPSITINRPLTTENIGYYNQNQTLNWTITDTNLDSIWWEYNGTNTTLYGASNQTTFTLQPNLYNGTLWANDSVGNVNSSFRNWSYKVFVNNETYDDELPSGALDEFSLNLTTKGGVSLTQAILNYNNTNYTTSITYSSGNYIIDASIYSPMVTEDTNFTFNFYLIVDGETYTLTSYNQSVLNLDLGICGGVSNDTLLNLYLKDEIAKTTLTGDIEVGGSIISKSSGQTVATIYQNFTNTTNASICFSPPSDYDLYYLSSEIRYVADGYAPELYIIQYADMDDYPVNISLYDLDLNHSTEFLIKYQDDSLITVEGAVIQLLRKYISEGIYELVEAPLTSNIGTSVVHVDLNTNLYRAIVVKNGVILDTFNNLVFDCESELSGLCTQNLFGLIDPQNSVDVDNLNDFSYSISELNNTITTTFSIPSGTPSSINVALVQEDVFGNTYLCNQTITSSSGSIDCSYNETIGDSVIYLKVNKDNNLMVDQSYYIAEDGTLDFLGNNFFIVLIFLLSLVGMAMASPEFMVVIGVVTFVLAGGLWLLNGLNFVIGLGSIIWLIIVAVIIILKLSKQEDR